MQSTLLNPIFLPPLVTKTEIAKTDTSFLVVWGKILSNNPFYYSRNTGYKDITSLSQL